MTVLAAVAAAFAAAVLTGSPVHRGRDRLRAVLPTHGTARADPSLRSPARTRRAAALVAGVGLGVLVGGPAGILVAVGAAVGLDQGLSRFEPRADRERRERLVADLPLALDLMAACLHGGSPLDETVAVVAAAVGGPLGSALEGVVSASRLGAPPGQAWARLGHPPELAVAARAIARAAEGGTGLADAVTQLALEQREAARAAGEEAARRAGVLAAAPLGLCFLPAFVLIGVVPVIAGVAGQVLR